MPAKKEGGSDVKSKSTTSCRVRKMHTSAVGSSPMPTKLSKQCPQCQIPKQSGRHHKRPYHLNGILIFSLFIGMPATILIGWSPWRDLAISVGGWLVDSSWCGTTSQGRAAGAVVRLAGLVCGPGCPPPWTSEKHPLVWAQKVLLQLCSLGGDSNKCNGMILPQLENGMSSRTSLSQKVVSGSIFWWSSTALSTRWQGSPGRKGWAFSAQYWKGLSIS